MADGVEVGIESAINLICEKRSSIKKSLVIENTRKPNRWLILVQKVRKLTLTSLYVILTINLKFEQIHIIPIQV